MSRRLFTRFSSLGLLTLTNFENGIWLLSLHFRLLDASTQKSLVVFLLPFV